MVKSTGLCRSLIFKNGKLLVFSPPKSVSYTTFQNESVESDIYAQEFIEGTMINLFFDPTLGDKGEWEIATRSTVGANVSFYQESHTKTFRTMFLEASNHVKLDLDKLPKEYCYSFVLQHPNNRIVKPIMEPMLYLVAVYSISNSLDSEISIEEVSFPSDYITKETAIKTPMNYKYNLTELVDKYASVNTSYDVVGFILKNSKTGERCKFRNPVYEEVRYLRGNQPKLLFQYLSLRQQGRLKNYLKYYSEHRFEFSQMRQRVHNFTEALHNNYLRYYVYKEMSLNECPYQYRSHIGVLHKQYLYNLRASRLKSGNSNRSLMASSKIILGLESSFSRNTPQVVIAEKSAVSFFMKAVS